MATLLVPETYATITLAIAAASNSDTISVNDGTYTEQIDTGALTDVLITSRGTDPTAVIIQYDGTPVAGSTVTIGGGCTLYTLTVKYTGVGAYLSSGSAIYGAAGAGVATLYNCRIFSEWNGVLKLINGSILERCIFECTDTSNSAIGIYSAGGQLIIGSCIIRNFPSHLIYCPQAVVVNTLAVTNKLTANSAYRFIYALQHYNNIARNQDLTKVGHSGIAANGSGSTFSRSSTCWGGFTTEFSGLTTDIDHITSAQVVTDGNDLFVDDAAYDFHINNAGLDYQSGDPLFQNTYGRLLEDLDGVTYDLGNISRGPYEFVASGGGGIANSVIKSTGGGLLSSPFTLTP